jgi:hypothetical protein
VFELPYLVSIEYILEIMSDIGVGTTWIQMIIDVSCSVRFHTNFHDVCVSSTRWGQYRGRGTVFFVAQRLRFNFELSGMAAESTLSAHSLSQQESWTDKRSVYSSISHRECFLWLRINRYHHKKSRVIKFLQMTTSVWLISRTLNLWQIWPKPVVRPTISRSLSARCNAPINP